MSISMSRFGREHRPKYDQNRGQPKSRPSSSYEHILVSIT
jgi:hypothetical protein